MRIATPALCAGLALALSACAGDGPRTGLARLNPLGLFGGSEPVSLAGPDAPPGIALRRDDGRGPVERITALSVRPMPGGALVEARGLPPVQGAWDVGLVALNRGRPVGGVLDYELRVEPPPVAPRVGPPASREVVAAAFVSDGVLREVSTIRVRGLRDARAVRR